MSIGYQYSPRKKAVYYFCSMCLIYPNYHTKTSNLGERLCDKNPEISAGEKCSWGHEEMSETQHTP